MDVEQLRARQQPLKDRYRQDPSAARTPISATGSFADDGITATIDSWAGPVRAGLHRATGGDGSDACSGDLLMEALLACAGVTLRSVSTAMRIELADVALRADGAFDARGTLGLDKEVPVAVLDVVVTAEVSTDATDDQLRRLAELTERYCVVGRSLATPPRVQITRR